MPVWRLQTSIGADSPDARDRFVITPHLDDGGVTTDPQQLCEDWADTLIGWELGATRQIEVTAYDAQGTPPVFPQGHAIRNAGLFPSSSCPREVALCLSFYSERNLPRQRGRLYIPMPLLMANHSIGQARPSTPLMEKVLNLGEGLSNLGGNDVDWVVYSRVDDEARPVSNSYVDDEWDTIRSRGLRPTTRVADTHSE